MIARSLFNNNCKYYIIKNNAYDINQNGIGSSLMQSFAAFNLTISSALRAPSAFASINSNHAADVIITLGKVEPPKPHASMTTGPFYYESATLFWLHVPNIARFIVCDGKTIVIDPDNTVDEATLNAFVLECCFKALLKQRGFTVIQGCAIQTGAHTVAFMAPSGFGKSILCYLFLQRGYSIVSEALLVIDTDNNIVPSYPYISLWSSTATQLGLDIRSRPTVRPNLDKYVLPLGSAFCEKILPLHTAYSLRYHKENQLKIMPTIDKSKLPSSVNCVDLICPRWEYGMTQLGHLLPTLFDAIEADLMHRVMSPHTSVI